MRCRGKPAPARAYTELTQAPPRRDVPRRVLPYRVVRDRGRIEGLEAPERQIGRGHDPGFDEAHAVHPPPHRVVAHRRAGWLVEGAHPFPAVALVGGDVAVQLDDVAPVARMAPGAVLLRAHDVEQVPRGENPSLAVDHHVRADGAGARALRGTARDDHGPGEARGYGNGLAEHPRGSINVPSEEARPSTYRARKRVRRGPRAFAPASGVPAAASCLPSGPGVARPSAIRSRLDGRNCRRHVPGVADHYSQPRSRKADRSTPDGANQPPAPYLAPSFIATSLLP